MKEILTAMVCCISLVSAVINDILCAMCLVITDFETAAYLFILSGFLFYSCNELYRTISHFEIY